MTFVDIEWLKANSWPTPEATESVASEIESSGSVTRAGSESDVHNGKRGFCTTKSVASQMPRKTLCDTTKSVATSTPVFDPVVDTPAPIGASSRSQVSEDATGTTMSDDRSEAKARSTPKAKPTSRPFVKCAFCMNEAYPMDRYSRCSACKLKMENGWQGRKPVPLEVQTAAQIADLLGATGLEYSDDIAVDTNTDGLD